SSLCDLLASVTSRRCCSTLILILFCNGAAPCDTPTLSLHDALPISVPEGAPCAIPGFSVRDFSFFPGCRTGDFAAIIPTTFFYRSEEHTSELQSRENFVCRLLLE